MYTAQERSFEITVLIQLVLYITNELSVVSSASSAIAKFVHENRVGLTTTPEFLSEEVLQIAQDGTLRRKLNDNSRKISNEYCFDTTLNKVICISLKNSTQEKEAGAYTLEGETRITERMAVEADLREIKT